MVKVLHIKSNAVTDNKPKLPTKEQIEYGEIAVNYAADHETISLRNSNDEIKTFSSDEYYTKQKLGTAFTNSNVTDVLNNVHETLAAAVNNLNDKKADRESVDNLNGDLQKKVSIDDFKTYSAATNTKINGKSNTGHTHTLSEITDYKTYDEKIQTAIGKKQNQLTAGDGIKIENDTISTTLDTTIFRFANALPTENIELNKLYFVPSAAQGEQNIYTEYAYHDNAWEILGQYKADVDLASYAKTEDVDTKIADSEQVIAGGLSELKNKVDAAVATTYTKTDIDRRLDEKLETSFYEADKRSFALKSDTIDRTTYTIYTAATDKAIQGLGKVDDVKVDGNSVVEGKVATIDLTPYAKTADTYTKTEVDAKLSQKQDALTIDDKLDEASANAVQNKVIAAELEKLTKAISIILNDINDRLNTLSDTVAKQIKNSAQ